MFLFSLLEWLFQALSKLGSHLLGDVERRTDNHDDCHRLCLSAPDAGHRRHACRISKHGAAGHRAMSARSGTRVSAIVDRDREPSDGPDRAWHGRAPSRIGARLRRAAPRLARPGCQ